MSNNRLHAVVLSGRQLRKIYAEYFLFINRNTLYLLYQHKKLMSMVLILALKLVKYKLRYLLSSAKYTSRDQFYFYYIFYLTGKTIFIELSALFYCEKLTHSPIFYIAALIVS